MPLPSDSPKHLDEIFPTKILSACLGLSHVHALSVVEKPATEPPGGGGFLVVKFSQPDYILLYSTACLHSLRGVERQEVRLRLHDQGRGAPHVQDVRCVPVSHRVDEHLVFIRFKRFYR